MVRVTPIKLQAGTRVLWLDPAEHTVCAGDHVIVSTERGSEFGVATADIMEVSDEMIAQLKSPLKPVLRIADEADIERADELRQKGEEALSTFKELAAETNEQMRPVMVEFLFDGDKAVFYFESEERIDFRDLVRKLASVFHVRVDMRQIGVRDGARMIGGLGHCGQELCCARMGGEFSPVSIRMAKEQNLSLNPQKISGCCGRLMCCLRYEYEAYKEVNARAPKNGAKIEIPDGFAKVTEINVPLERVTLQLEDGKTIKVPLAEMEISGEAKRPNRISKEVYEKYALVDPLSMFTTSTSAADLEVSSFTTEDKLAEPKARVIKHLHNEDSNDSATTHRKPRRRRSVELSVDGSVEIKKASQEENDSSDQRRGASSNESSGRKNDKESRQRRRMRRDKSDKQSGEGNESKQHQSGSSSEGGAGKQKALRKQRRTSSNRVDKQSDRGSQNHDKRDRADARSRRRPGQKSSGVRNAPVKSEQHTTKSVQRNRVTASNEAKQRSNHRRPRRRHHTSGGEQGNAE